MAMFERSRNTPVLIVGAFACIAALAIGVWIWAGDAKGPTSVAVVEIDLPAKSRDLGGGVLSPPAFNRPAPNEANGATGRLNHGGPDIEGGFVVPSVTPAAFSWETRPPQETVPLAPIDPALVEKQASALLPRIAEDGRTPWRVYARPFDSRDDRPRIAIVIVGVGLSPVTAEAAIEHLPGAISLAMDPYAADVAELAREARQYGHEVLVSVPFESADFPFEDPGPSALLTTLEPEENVQRLESLLGRFPGYLGVVSSMGSKFSKSEDQLLPVLETLKVRGLMFLDGAGAEQSVGPRVATEIGLPRAFVDIVIDEDPSAAEIERQLARLEDIARQRAVAVAVARPYPISLRQLSKWAATLESQDLVLAPISSVVDAQFLP
jgi:hypothetical protein